MTTMLDKVSAAIEAKIRPAQPIYDWDSKDIARAALQAIRVPTDEMDGAGFEALKTEQGKSSLGTCSVVFTAMIDAILSESTNP